MPNPKYALLSGADVLALCADVDGLFADPAPPARARYELRGCEPRGPLARAVTQAVVEGTAPQGELLVRTADGVSRLLDVRVLGIRGDVVTVEARTPPLRERDRRDAVDCANLIRVSPEEPEEATHTEVTFLGCSPRGALRGAVESGGPALPGPVTYERLARAGTAASGTRGARITGWAPSEGDAHARAGLLDLTVLVDRRDLRPPAVADIWELWWGCRPEEPGTWARFPSGTRGAWLEQARRRSEVPDPPADTYHLDGTHVVDADSFWCALGEAFLGPGGYLAEDLDQLHPPFEPGTTLVWHDAHVARTCLGVLPRTRNRPPTFEEIVVALACSGVTVEFA
ncbi:hypothetical protein [Streptomyces showdoensis]|uniref:Barstar (barnase inhibitor) domain-containing protein n=1 Tax=Streptomyces showdoensis TaxID=68268 RepID=A0A2P2GNS4_STREW|nr:hypothetical protein [Streptomyces showdoensis]KKZ72519.1 hypothetical protein VO63_18265 [Streptomyces showdoensis]